MRDERREKKGLTDVSGVCCPRLDSPLNSEELLSTEKHLNPFLCFSAFSLLSVQWSRYSCFLQTFLISLAFLWTLVSESGSLVELLTHLVSTFPCWVHGFKYSLELWDKMSQTLDQAAWLESPKSICSTIFEYLKYSMCTRDQLWSVKYAFCWPLEMGVRISALKTQQLNRKSAHVSDVSGYVL